MLALRLLMVIAWHENLCLYVAATKMRLIFSCCRIYIFVVAASGMETFFLFHDSIKTITFGFNFVLDAQI
jgi:hypothetical protein